MSTITTARSALSRRAGTLLVAAALVGASATSAVADPTISPTADAGPPASASTSPTTTATGSPTPTVTLPGDPSATTTPLPTPTIPTSPTSPSGSSGPSSPAPSPTGSPTPTIPESAAPSGKAGVLPLLAANGDEAAAAFISSTLAAANDHYVYPNSTFFDGGNTIDAIIALSAVGTQQSQSNASLAYLEDNLDTYIGAGGEVYAGPLAKALLATVVTGSDPTSFGGHDLVAELQALETTKGRFSDDSAYGDYSNTIGQSLAVLALSRAGEGLNAVAVQAVLDQQCADGGFRGTLYDSAGCVSDADATAFAVQAMLMASDTLVCGDDAGLPARAAAAAGRGLDLLEDVQDASGGFASADGAVNANTTGVAAQAFVAGGRTAAAATAGAFVATLQYDESTPVPLPGGIAFSADTRSTTVPTDSDLRATPQATLGLAGGSLVDAVAPGVEGAAPGSTCPPVPTRQPVTVAGPTTTPSASIGPTSGGDPTPGATVSDPSASVTSAATGSLAQTGTDPLVPAGLGLLLVLAGALAVWASSRRRGAHS